MIHLSPRLTEDTKWEKFNEKKKNVRCRLAVWHLSCALRVKTVTTLWYQLTLHNAHRRCVSFWGQYFIPGFLLHTNNGSVEESRVYRIDLGIMGISKVHTLTVSSSPWAWLTDQMALFYQRCIELKVDSEDKGAKLHISHTGLDGCSSNGTWVSLQRFFHELWLVLVAVKAALILSRLWVEIPEDNDGWVLEWDPHRPLTLHLSLPCCINFIIIVFSWYRTVKSEPCYLH